MIPTGCHVILHGNGHHRTPCEMVASAIYIGYSTLILHATYISWEMYSGVLALCDINFSDISLLWTLVDPAASRNNYERLTSFQVCFRQILVWFVNTTRFSVSTAMSANECFTTDWWTKLTRGTSMASSLRWPPSTSLRSVPILTSMWLLVPFPNQTWVWFPFPNQMWVWFPFQDYISFIRSLSHALDSGYLMQMKTPMTISTWVQLPAIVLSFWGPPWADQQQ